jgi:hypothetical protein
MTKLPVLTAAVIGVVLVHQILDRDGATNRHAHSGLVIGLGPVSNLEAPT